MINTALHFISQMHSSVMSSASGSSIRSSSQDNLLTTRTSSFLEQTIEEESSEGERHPVARYSPISQTSVGSGVPTGILNHSNIVKLKVLFLDSRKGRSNSHVGEMNASLAPQASKFDFYLRQCIPGLFFQRFFRHNVEALNDLKAFALRLDVCDKAFFDRWRSWRPTASSLVTARGKELQLRARTSVKSGGPKPTNEKRWIDMYTVVRKQALSNWILFFDYPSPRIFLNALQYNYGNIYPNGVNIPDVNVYFELEFGRKSVTVPCVSALTYLNDIQIYLVDEGVLLGSSRISF